MKIYIKSESTFIAITGTGERFIIGNGIVMKTNESIDDLEETQSDIGHLGAIGEAVNNSSSLVSDELTLKMIYCAVQESIS